MKNQNISPFLLRQFFLILIILGMAYLIISYLIPYISGVLGAIILYVVCRNWMDKLVKRNVKRWVAASLLLLLTFVGILVPIGGMIYLLQLKIAFLFKNPDYYIELAEKQLVKLETNIGIDISSQLQDVEVGQLATTVLESAAINILDFTIIIGLLYFLLYYMLINFDKLGKVVESYFPMKNNNYRELQEESFEVVKSNAIAIPLVALMQGIVAIIGFYIFDVPDPLFWGTVTFIGSMIPFVGTFVGIAPTVLLLYFNGENTNAIGLMIYGLAVVGSTDNLFRMFVQQKLAEIHPLITLVGVIIGIPLFGFLGLVFGPLLISLLLVALRLYKKEYYV